MDLDSPFKMRWACFGAPVALAEALVLQVYGPTGAADVEIQVLRWRPVVPRSAFAGLEIDLDARRIAFAPIQEMVSSEAKRLGIDLSQIVTISSGLAARRVLDLLLCNALVDVHAVLIDLPSAGVVVGYPPARGALRFVQHRRSEDPYGRRFDEAIHVLRLAGLDVRTMMMPDGEAATERAVDAFLVELVARASRAHPCRRSTVSSPPRPEQSA